ncbi:unnamed protein product [Rotaria sp. Silwood1]|nr:unnamed protein product [Rotaria sp. Silwood1]
MLLLTSILIAVLLAIVVTYFLHTRKTYEFFKRLNIPGSSPIFFFGNFFDLVRNKRTSISIKQYTEKYGRIFGYFEGHTPILVVSDPDVIQDIFIKSFSNFHSHRAFPLDEQHSKQVHLFYAIGLRWKRQRLIINPIFSSTKLKQMSPMIHRCINMFMKKIIEEYNKGQSFDIYPYFKRFAMDTLWSCVFGIDTDMQNNINDPSLIFSQCYFEEQNSAKVLVLLSLFIKELNYVWIKLRHINSFIRYWLRRIFPFTNNYIQEEPYTWIIREAYKIIDEHQQNNLTNRADVIKLMLESVSNEDFIQDDQPSTMKKEQKDDVVAGYETTSTALSYISYILATHPNEQVKLQENIDAYFNPETDEDDILSYDAISQIEYLDMFIRETLRMYPIAPVVINRQSTEELNIKNIGTIPVGTCVAVDMYGLHFDPDLWGPVDPHIQGVT